MKIIIDIYKTDLDKDQETELLKELLEVIKKKKIDYRSARVEH